MSRSSRPGSHCAATPNVSIGTVESRAEPLAGTGVVATAHTPGTAMRMALYLVEAASPALIEKVRTVVTDGSGQYRLIELRPGTYTVTFTLAGFNTFRREGIELEGTFVATVNAELRVGALEETIVGFA